MIGLVLAPNVPVAFVFTALAGLGTFIPFGVFVMLGQDYLPNRIGTASGLTVGAAEEVIRIMPPLTIGDAEIAEGLAIIERVAAARSARAMPPPKVAHHG